jgi:hypothetical protein
MTCKVCGEVPDLETHEYCRVAKRIHCDGQHFSNDQNFQVVKDDRAALTQTMLADECQRVLGTILLGLRSRNFSFGYRRKASDLSPSIRTR